MKHENPKEYIVVYIHFEYDSWLERWEIKTGDYEVTAKNKKEVYKKFYDNFNHDYTVLNIMDL